MPFSEMFAKVRTITDKAPKSEDKAKN
jgi:hypothetical protein